jgi:hypothetical protein
MNPRPIEAEAIDNKTLLVKFNNGEMKKVDISVFLNYPMYKELNDYHFFKQVKADGMTVYWNDDIDIDPDYLYENGVKLLEELD